MHISQFLKITKSTISLPFTTSTLVLASHVIMCLADPPVVSASAPVRSPHNNLVPSQLSIDQDTHFPQGRSPHPPWPTKPCATCHIPSLPSLPLCPLAHSAPATWASSLPPTHEAQSCLRAFAQAVPAAWKVPCPGVYCLSLDPCSNVGFVLSPRFKAVLSQSLLPL